MISFHSILLLLALFNECQSRDRNLGVKYGQRCSQNVQCKLPYTYCEVISPSCGAGVCSCRPGYILDGKECKRAVFLDGRCNHKTDKCVGDNVECSLEQKKCICMYGYNRGLRGTDCIPSSMIKSAGESCGDSTECYYSLVCIEGFCGCYNGYKDVDDYYCVPRQVYDTCSSRDDCIETPNTLCNNGVCSCAEGYKAVQYVLNETMIYRSACIAGNDRLRNEAEECNLSSSTAIYCKPPFVCTSCGDKHVCARRRYVLKSSAAVIIGRSSLFIFPVLCIFYAFIF